MKTEQDINLYLNTIVKEGLYSSKSRLKFQMDMLFRGVDLKDKKVLDIGGGYGLFSLYAASRGAKKVICLEPEADGCTWICPNQPHKV